MKPDSENPRKCEIKNLTRTNPRFLDLLKKSHGFTNKVSLTTLAINSKNIDAFVGYSYEPYRVASRIVTLMVLLASLSLYAAYTANIVALLQSTTDTIKTPKDLLYSPLSLGVQDTVYNRHYFKVGKLEPRK